jgi:hypothetical protein
MNPYQGLPDAQFWRRSISAVEAHRIDPVGDVRVRIGTEDRVGTAGSCFAQHISRRLSKLGLNYLVTEAGGDLLPEERQARQFALFSARYGNIYTPTQFLQLIEEAFGHRRPLDRAWLRKGGGWVDPFRPTVEPEGFATREALAEDRDRHLAAVRRLISEIDVLVFTLGLTEAWRSKRDGSVYPLAPGVVGGDYDESEHEFVNFSLAETEAAMVAALEAIKAVNPRVRAILTVSPVPLIATFERRSVLVSTAYSKAVLRVTAESMIQRFDWVDYFPSYEIITGPATASLYFEEDRREVNSLGVAHVMRIFEQHHLEGATADARMTPLASPEVIADAGVVCDEAMIEAVRG